ncbi:DNA -binding domain-containing protein [Mesorhizobium amorphae]|uniref:DNA -binding domain-containing protein n=1 Tax=Mesorhizobium amorphae TaxID=71433 RepID=UPI0011824C13|nr:DUF2285 domain-containing protein [Mesorhizobium amorphae]
MSHSQQYRPIPDNAPSADHLTPYDKEHFAIYLQLLDACANNASEEEMARDILGIDPTQEPARARNSVRSHLERTQWLITSGYRELFPN